MPEFNLLRGGLQDRFLASRAKIQLFGGGFGNGKSTAAVMKALQISQSYPGSNILMARSTYPKLNDTLRKEFIKWCPKQWVKSFPMSAASANMCTLTNGTQFPFRYIAQQGKSEESSTSNLLSATYDLIVVDQMEDPEISFKDFLDLLGRLRGNTPYRGDDPTMPRTGPRWMLLTANPTRNWVYTELVEPLFKYLGHGRKGDPDYYAGGEISDKLLCIRDDDNKPMLLNNRPQLLIEIVEGSTYENKHNLPADFIQMQESAYQGQMKDRYLLGKWAAYEGLVYPQFNEALHMVDPRWIRQYLDKLDKQGYEIEWLEGYDYGLAAPSCYLASFVDPSGNVIVVDGYYKAEYELRQQFSHIKRIRHEWGIDLDNVIDGDPDLMKRGKGGINIAHMFWEDGHLHLRGAYTAPIPRITKVGQYLNVDTEWTNPFTLDVGAPKLYMSLDLRFIVNEITSWYWKKDQLGKRIDEPQAGNDHSLDTIGYMLTSRPDASKLKPSEPKSIPSYMVWNEQDVRDEARSRRHG